MTMPIRIQRRRTKGWRMPPGTVYVGRPTKWGNPLIIGDHDPADVVRAYKKLLRISGTQIVKSCSNPPLALHVVAWREQVKRSLPELRGKNLCCWCPLDQPCHADVLLELANAG